MKVQLVSATYDCSATYHRKFLGVACIHAAAVSDPDISRDVDLQHDHYDLLRLTPEDLAQRILAVGADIVGFGAYIWNIREVLAAARVIKASSPRTRLLIGGPEVSYHSRRYLEQHEWIDWICAGEGELTFPELLLQQLREPGAVPDSIPGMCFRHDGRVGMAPARSFNPNLNDLPSPHLLGLYGVDPVRGTSYMETTRGCPFVCTYCDYGRNQPYYEYGLERFRQEIRYLRDNKCRAVLAIDATFNYQRKRAIEILHTVAEESFEGVFACELFPSLIDDELLEAVAGVKRAHLGIGIQSVHPETMKNIRRKWDPARVQGRIDRLCAMPNVTTSLELIMGLPGDNLQAFMQTVDWAYARQPHHVFALPLQILSRTPLEQQLEEFGIEHTGPEGGNEIIRSDSFPPQEVIRGRAMCLWLGLIQPVVHRLWRLLDVSPAAIVLRWAEFAYHRGVHDRLDELRVDEVSHDMLDLVSDAFRDFVDEVCREQGRPDISRKLADLLRYLLLRRALSRPRAFFLDVEEIECMTTSHRVYSAVAGDLPSSNGLDGARVPAPTGQTHRHRFAFDMQTVYAELDIERMHAIPEQESEFVFYSEPATGAGRAVRVDDHARRLLDRCDGVRSLDQIAAELRGGEPGAADPASRSVAAVLTGCGVLTWSDGAP